MENFWSNIILEIGSFQITGAQLTIASLQTLGLLVLDWLILFWLLRKLFRRFDVEQVRRRQVRRRFQPLFLYLVILTWMWTCKVDYTLYQDKMRWIGISTLIQALMFWQIAFIVDLILGRVILRNFFQTQGNLKNPILGGGSSGLQRTLTTSNRYIKYAVYVITLMAMLSLFQTDFTFFEGKVGKGNYALRISNVLIASLVILMAQLLIWLIIHLFLANFYRRRSINIGSQFAFNQLVNYLIYFIAGMIALHFVGVNITVIAGGAVALLVGVGIGLQQTFNDFFSGILLLFERSVEVGDWVEIDGLVGKVRRIGPRTSVVQTRDNRSVIVPNSRLVINNVTNWSHGDDVARFTVEVGVAYGSDTQMVKELLIAAAKQHPKVLENPPVNVRMVLFGDSSLDFEVYFWSNEFMGIEDVKSDIRLEIDQKFREHKIEIPFTQTDVWVRNWDTKK
ncbi:mechanosensitive ion channel family protein [Haliscomenobacter sp.]|uniref:mechanosensitive ion channel family protein n=1 Tax=Haliscomenobacter sp. TaxID=2717303 RepID=UPI0035946055